MHFVYITSLDPRKKLVEPLRKEILPEKLNRRREQSADDLEVSDIVVLNYCPIVSSEAERVFSEYKNILAENT